MFYAILLPHLPLEIGKILHLNPFYSRTRLIEIGPGFFYYLSLEKSRALHLNKLISPSPEDGLCQVWLKVIPEKTTNTWKVYANVNDKDNNNDDDEQRTHFNQPCALEVRNIRK